MFRNRRILTLTGAAFLGYYGLYVPVSGAYRHFVREPHNLPERYGKGSWAVVTGSSDGIGKAFAYELARQGFNLYLISRTESKLEAICKEVEEEYKVQTRHLVKDFENANNAEFFSEIEDGTKDLDVSILINNVGRGRKVAPDGNQVKNDIDTVILNTCSQAGLSALFVPKMAAREHKSGVVNLSSVAGGKPLAMNPVYSATKAFNDYLSRASQWEHEDKVDFLSVRPGWVSTPLINNQEVGGYIISAEDCVQTTLAKLGHDDWTNGHWRHAIFYTIYFRIIPDFIFQGLAVKKTSYTKQPESKTE